MCVYLAIIYGQICQKSGKYDKKIPLGMSSFIKIIHPFILKIRFSFRAYNMVQDRDRL